MGWLRHAGPAHAQLLAFFGLVRRWHPQSGRTRTGRESGAQSGLASLVRRLPPWRLMSPNQRALSLFPDAEAAEEHEVKAASEQASPDRFAVRLTSRCPMRPMSSMGRQLTGAFVGVRYAGAEADRAQTERLKRVWAALRASLPARKEGDSAS